MNGKPLDDSWRRWLEENLERQCDPGELVRILVGHEFSLDSIRQCMRERFPHGAGDQRLDDSWHAWLKQNLDRRCDPEELRDILLRRGFSLDSVREAMGERFPPGRAPAERPNAADPPLIRQGRAGLTRIESDRLQLYTLDDFLSGAECDGLIELINDALRPSTITFGDSDFRTSRTCDLSVLRDHRAAALDEKICRTIGIRRPYAEVNQGQRYDVGQQFKPHTDFFEPGTGEYLEHAAHRGNRTWTFMVYLNEGMEGGGTKFMAIDRVFSPRRGQALLWNNLRRDGSPNYDTLHSGLPVTKGFKVVVTQWFRERGEGPMFYEG
jgi:prolyl 4-hydroxylase